MKKNKRKINISSFGFSTILLSFVMICVVTFSALSLVTANSDYKLSKKVADKNKDYFRAEERAYDKLSLIDDILLNARNDYSDEAGYYAKISEQLKQYGIFETNNNEYIFSFDEKISANNYLTAKIKIYYPENENQAFYDIIQWKSTYETENFEDETLNLID